MTWVLAPFTLSKSPIPGPRMQRPDPRHVVLEVEPDLASPRPGRPQIGPRISTCVTVETLAQIERFAEEWQVSRAEAQRVLLNAAISALRRPPQDREWMHVRDSGGNAVAIIDDLFRGTTRPPSSRQADDEFDLRSEIEASAEAQGLSPAALLGVGYGAALARRGGK